MNQLVRTAETYVVDTQTGSIYQVDRPDRITYKLEPVIGDQVLKLDEWNYKKHFHVGLFKYVNRG